MAYFGKYDGSRFPKTTQQCNFSSPLYVLQSDLTKAIVSVWSAQDFVDQTGNASNATNATYTNITKVPAGCRGFIPYYYANVAHTAITNGTGNISLVATHATVTILYTYFFGRFGNVDAPYTNDPYAISASHSVPSQTYGYWRQLGCKTLTASSGGTTTTIIADSGGTIYGTLPTLGNTSNLDRFLMAGLWTGSTCTTPFSTLPSATASAQSNMEMGAIPTMGASEILCFLTYGSSSTGTITTATTAGTLHSSGIACSFVS